MCEDEMTGHTNKIIRLLNKDLNVDEHIVNMSSYELSFFQKLVLRRGHKFSIPQPATAREVQASFENACWRLGPTLAEEKSIVSNYIERRGPRPPNALQRAM